MKIEIHNSDQFHSGPGGFAARTIVLTLAIVVAIAILPGVRIVGGSLLTALLTAMVIALLDNFIRPILIFVTLPLTIVSVGLFIFFINAVIIELAAAIVGPFQVDSFGYALLFSLLITGLNYLLELPNKWLNKKNYQLRGQQQEEDHFDDYEEVNDDENSRQLEP